MSLTIKQLNTDTSFLLTLESIDLDNRGSTGQLAPFRILLDPWISEQAAASTSTKGSPSPRRPSCITNLDQLTEPDLVIITSARSDHCHETTLRQLPSTSRRTVILAEPRAVRRIRSWKYFDDDMVRELPRWEDHRGHATNNKTVARIEIPSQSFGGESGEVTVAHISQRKDIKSFYTAFGITYRPPTHTKSNFRRPSSRSPSVTAVRPSTAPTTSISPVAPQLPVPNFPKTDLQKPIDLVTLTPPASPTQQLGRKRSAVSLSPQNKGRGISVIFSPHGIPYAGLQPYATSHLLREAALPLTALIHCFDTVTHPWWKGGESSLGMPAAQETAHALGARAWVGAHDGHHTSEEKRNSPKGFSSKLLHGRHHRYDVKQVRDVVEEYSCPSSTKKPVGDRPTEVMALAAGEEVCLTSEGIWETMSYSEEEDEVMPLPVHAYPTPMSSIEWLAGPCY